MNIVKTIKSLIRGYRNEFSPNDRKIVEQYGNYRVTRIVIMRTPIHSMIDSAINLLSLGKWEESKDKYSFDKLFHLFAILTLSNGEGHKIFIRIEKNEVITMTLVDSNFSPPQNTQTIAIDYIQQKLTFNELLDNMIKKYGEQKVFTYNPWTNNCQDFLMMLLDSSGLLNSNTKDFIKQDISMLVNDVPNYTKSIGEHITSLAHRKDILLKGGNVYFMKGRKL